MSDCPLWVVITLDGDHVQLQVFRGGDATDAGFGDSHADDDTPGAEVDATGDAHAVGSDGAES
jgi:hypothetical protein